jgi:hypothetical protein
MSRVVLVIGCREPRLQGCRARAGRIDRYHGGEYSLRISGYQDRGTEVSLGSGGVGGGGDRC